MRASPEVQIDDWRMNVLICSACRRWWLAVHPAVERVPCPSCGYWEQVPPIPRIWDALQPMDN